MSKLSVWTHVLIGPNIKSLTQKLIVDTFAVPAGATCGLTVDTLAAPASATARIKFVRAMREHVVWI